MSGEPGQVGEWAGLLDEGARSMGLSLGEKAIQGMAAYGAILVEAGERGGFHAPGDPRELVGKHLLDAAACLLAVEPETGAEIADVGSGAGLPGLVLAICLPTVRVVLIEARGGRAGFARWSALRLGLNNVEVIHGRSEQVAVAGRRFHRVVSRALAPVGEAAGTGLALVRPGGGLWVPMLGPGGEEELRLARKSISQAGGEWTGLVRYELPWGLGKRCLGLVRRTGMAGEGKNGGRGNC